MPIFNKRWGCRLKELKGNQKFRKPSPVKDAAGLSSLAGFLNATAGVVAPRESLPVAAPIKAPPIVEPTQQSPVASPSAATAPALNLNRVFMTGRLKSGKDFCLERAGFKIHALAQPLYYLAEYFFGQQPKDAARTFLQTVGQWGRGTVDASHPLTPERALFTKMVRAEFSGARRSEGILCVDWENYGRNENLWLDALVTRVKAEPAGARIAVSGVRFQNEHARLTAEGFVGFHCMCSPATWTARLKQVGFTPESPAARDVSEHLAAALDLNVTKTLSQQPQGNKLRCVWSDGEVLPPSRRLLSVQEFVNLFPK